MAFESSVTLTSLVSPGSSWTFAQPTSRLGGVSLHTVLRFAARAGGDAEAFHDELVPHVTVRQVQADEAWSFVGKKR